MKPDPAIKRSILASLHQFGRRVRFYVLIEGLAMVIASVAAVVLVQFGLDFLLSLDLAPRAALLLVATALILHQLWHRLLRPLGVHLNTGRLAATAEQCFPQLRDRLVSAVEFATGTGAPARARMPDESPEMRAAVVRQAIDAFEAVDLGALLRRERFRNYGILLLGTLGVGFAAARLQPEYMAVYLSRNVLLRDTPWPSHRRIELEGAQAGRIRWPRGDSLSLMVRVAAGHAPRWMSMEFRLADGTKGERPMSQLGQDRFRCDFGPLTDSMEVQFLSSRWGTAERSAWYSIEAVDRPRVEQAVVRITPPVYTRQKAYAFPTGQVAGDVPAGSQVEFEVTLNKPVVRAHIKSASQDLGPAEQVSDKRYRAVTRPERSGTFVFDLMDDLHLEDTRPVAFSIRLVADRAPVVRLTLPGVGTMIVADAVVPVQIEFEDNWGLASALFEYHVDHANAGAPATQPAAIQEPIKELEPYQSRFTYRRAWDLGALGLQVSDRLVMSALARDFKDIGEPNVGRSSAFNLRVVSREELLGELARREQEWRQEFEQILKGQEELRRRLSKVAAEADASERALRFGHEERPERQYAVRVRKVRTQFEQILAEMEINRLATPAIRRRLEEGVIRPLGELANDLMPSAADILMHLGRDSGHADLSKLEPLQADIVKMMNAVLANMLKWEGYNEAAALLRDIVKNQNDLKRDTQSELERQMERLFGPQSPGQ